MSRKVFLYCDDPSHSKVVAVTNFQAVRNGNEGWTGRWNEIYTSTAAQGRRESGVTLEITPDGDRVPTPGSIGGSDISDRQFRSAYRLVCRKCPRRPVVAREPKLFKALDRLADVGASKVSLSVLAAMLGEQ